MEIVETRLRPVAGRLAPGRTVMEAVEEVFAAAECIGGFGRLSGGAAQPFQYVMPALSIDEKHAASYSDRHAPEGSVVVEDAVLSFGRRDDMPFLHCHGLWRSADGKRRMGHMLPLDCRVSEPIGLEGLGSPSALFDAVSDAETNYTLCKPREIGPKLDRGKRGLFVRVAPNEDILTALEGIAAVHGVAEARIHGLGSLTEVAFSDGRRVPSLATELMITHGWIEEADGPKASLRVAVVDIDGGIHEGMLTRGDNPVCITFEVVIEILRGTV